MKRAATWSLLFAFVASSTLAQTSNRISDTKPTDTSPHIVKFVTVAPDVKLEVLDWGGTGRSLILLAGLNDDAHVFDIFAPKLVPAYHVYGVTRRGFGASSAPEPDGTNYSADRLGDDILAVMDVLKIERPVLVGHSIAGEEMSSIGTRYPGKVAGLVYLDAGYGYAYYDDGAKWGDPAADFVKVQSELDHFATLLSPRDRKTSAQHLLDVSLPRLERDLQEGLKQWQNIPDSAPAPPDTPSRRASLALRRGTRIYTGVTCPVLAIFAVPHHFPESMEKDPALADMIAEDFARVSAQADAFQKGNPNARIVRLANADHQVFRSNETDVLREINAFIATLP